MKSYGQLFEKVIDFENLWRAYRRARKGKRSRPDVAAFEYRLEGELCALRDELASRSYRPGPYRHFRITEPKPRVISAAPFRDRVVHRGCAGHLSAGPGTGQAGGRQAPDLPAPHASRASVGGPPKAASVCLLRPGHWTS